MESIFLPSDTKIEYDEQNEYVTELCDYLYNNKEKLISLMIVILGLFVLWKVYNRNIVKVGEYNDEEFEHFTNSVPTKTI